MRNQGVLGKKHFGVGHPDSLQRAKCCKRVLKTSLIHSSLAGQCLVILASERFGAWTLRTMFIHVHPCSTISPMGTSAVRSGGDTDSFLTGQRSIPLVTRVQAGVSGRTSGSSHLSIEEFSTFVPLSGHTPPHTSSLV